MQPQGEQTSAGEQGRRIVKRYSNRKLYDTRESRYVTLLQIAEMVRAGEEVQIIDNATKDDLTEVTLAQIIYEEQKHHTRQVPLQTLRDLIHQRGERLITQLRDSPLGRLIPGDEREGEEMSQGERRGLVDMLEAVQARIDESVKNALAGFLPLQQLQEKVTKLEARIAELESQRTGGSPPPA